MNKKRLSINLIGQLISFVCTLGISFFVTPYVVAHLGTEAYGFVGLANNFTNYIALFTVAINGMLSRYITVEYSKGDYASASGYFSTALITQVILAAVLLVPMGLLAGNIEYCFSISSEIVLDVKILWSLIFLSFLVGFPAGGFGVAAFAKNRLEISALVGIVTNIVRVAILLITFVFFTPHVWYIGLATIVANIVGITIQFFVKRKLMPEVSISKEYFDWKYIYKLLVVGVWNSLNKLQQILYSGLDLLLTNLFISGTEMGILSIAKTVPTQISTLINTVSGTFDPSMTIVYGKGNLQEFIRQTKFAMKLNGFLCSVPILGFIAFGTNFYELWMPSLTETEIIKVQTLAVLTLLPQVFSVYIYPLYTVNTITTKLKVPVLLSIAIGMVNVGTVFVLLKTTNLGVYAVAGVSSVLWVFRIFLFVPSYAAWSIQEKWSTFYPPLFKGILNIVVVGGLMVIFAHFLHAKSWIELIVICLICGLIGYAICFFIMFDKEERNSVFRMLKRKEKKGTKA